MPKATVQTAEGPKTLSFPEGTSPEDMGKAVDEAFSSGFFRPIQKKKELGPGMGDVAKAAAKRLPQLTADAEASRRENEEANATPVLAALAGPAAGLVMGAMGKQPAAKGDIAEFGAQTIPALVAAPFAGATAGAGLVGGITRGAAVGLGSGAVREVIRTAGGSPEAAKSAQEAQGRLAVDTALGGLAEPLARTLGGALSWGVRKFRPGLTEATQIAAKSAGSPTVKAASDAGFSDNVMNGIKLAVSDKLGTDMEVRTLKSLVSENAQEIANLAVQKVGGTLEKGTAGVAMKAALEDIATNVKQVQKLAYDAVETALPQGVNTAIPAQNVIKQIKALMTQAPEKADRQLLQRVLDGAAGEMGMTAEQLTAYLSSPLQGKSVPYNVLQALKRAAYQEDSTIARTLYSNLKTAIHDNIPEAASKALQHADEFTAQVRHGATYNLVQKLVSKGPDAVAEFVTASKNPGQTKEVMGMAKRFLDTEKGQYEGFAQNVDRAVLTKAMGGISDGTESIFKIGQNLRNIPKENITTAEGKAALENLKLLQKGLESIDEAGLLKLQKAANGVGHNVVRGIAKIVTRSFGVPLSVRAAGAGVLAVDDILAHVAASSDRTKKVVGLLKELESGHPPTTERLARGLESAVRASGQPAAAAVRAQN